MKLAIILPAGDPASASEARRFAREIFAYWCLTSAVSGDAILVLSELVTNAVRYAGKPDQWLGVILEHTADGVAITVVDCSPTLPVYSLRFDDSKSERGRGGLLMCALCGGELPWSALVHGGKRVTAVVPDPRSALDQERICP
jgi:anti-sigma regulatory factor (Ser/Thr protein kinase)